LVQLKSILIGITMVKFLDGLSSYFGESLSRSSRLMTVKAEEEEVELVDPQGPIREACVAHHCEKYKSKLDTCNERVNSRSKTTETCFEELLDLMHCMDHCASEKLFSKLK